MRKGVRIASPCSADWNNMTGDGRVRFCPQCQLSVYNFAEMPEAEVEHLIEEREGRVCAKIYQRASGAILTKDSPVAFRVLPLLPGLLTKAPSAVLDLLIGAEHSIVPSPLVQVEQHETGISLLAYDSLGVEVGDAPFSIVNQEARIRKTGTTDQSGQLRFTGLEAGSYAVKLESSRFFTKQAVVVVQQQEMTEVEFELLSAKMGMIVEIDVGIVPHHGS